MRAAPRDRGLPGASVHGARESHLSRGRCGTKRFVRASALRSVSRVSARVAEHVRLSSPSGFLRNRLSGPARGQADRGGTSSRAQGAHDRWRGRRAAAAGGGGGAGGERPFSRPRVPSGLGDGARLPPYVFLLITPGSGEALPAVVVVYLYESKVLQFHVDTTLCTIAGAWVPSVVIVSCVLHHRFREARAGGAPSPTVRSRRPDGGVRAMGPLRHAPLLGRPQTQQRPCPCADSRGVALVRSPPLIS